MECIGRSTRLMQDFCRLVRSREMQCGIVRGFSSVFFRNVSITSSLHYEVCVYKSSNDGSYTRDSLYARNFWEKAILETQKKKREKRIKRRVQPCSKNLQFNCIHQASTHSTLFGSAIKIISLIFIFIHKNI